MATLTVAKQCGGLARLSLWLLPLLALLMQQQAGECRYLPTRSHGDDLDKLRELMLQILEPNNEEGQAAQQPMQQQQLQPQHLSDLNDDSGGSRGGAPNQRGSWLKRWTPPDAVDGYGRRYGTRGIYDNGRYY